MIHITRIDRVGIAVPELEPQLALLRDLFGFTPGPVVDDEAGGAQRVLLSMPGSSDVDWEISAPIGEHSYLRSFVEGPAGPGIHHALFRVPDLQATIEELQRLAIEPWSSDWTEGDEPLDECFIHPRRGGHGFLFRLRGPEGGADRPRPSEDREGTLGIVALNHLSHAHSSREELAFWYTNIFGMESFYRSPEDPERPFVTEVMETPTRQMRWEVLQPYGSHSFVQRFLERRGPGIHHVTFEVGDWGRALAACKAYGVDTFGARDGVTDGARWNETFIHPRQAGGVLVQLFWQERPGIWV